MMGGRIPDEGFWIPASRGTHLSDNDRTIGGCVPDRDLRLEVEDRLEFVADPTNEPYRREGWEGELTGTNDRGAIGGHGGHVTDGKLVAGQSRQLRGNAVFPTVGDSR